MFKIIYNCTYHNGILLDYYIIRTGSSVVALYNPRSAI